MHKILALAQNIGGFPKDRQISKTIGGFPKFRRMSKL
jgi:hypothetical protein